MPGVASSPRALRRVAGGTRGVPREGRQRRASGARASAASRRSDADDAEPRRFGSSSRCAPPRLIAAVEDDRSRGRAGAGRARGERRCSGRRGAHRQRVAADPERAAMAAIVAEVAAVERVAAAAPAATAATPPSPTTSPSCRRTPPPPPPPADAPIIVEPAYIARMRQQKEDAAARADAAAEAKAEAANGPASSSSAKGRSSCPAPTCWSTSRPSRTRDRQAGAVRHGRAPGAGDVATTACRARSARSTWARSSPCTSSRPRPARAPTRSPTSRTTWRWRSRRCGAHRRADPGQGRGRHRGAEPARARRSTSRRSSPTTRFSERDVASCRSRSARTSRARRSASTWPRCRTCWSPAPPARASRSRSTR